MKKFLPLFALVLVPELHAEALQFKAKVIGSEARLDLGQRDLSVGALKLNLGSSEQDESLSQSAYGFGAAMEIPFTEAFRWGVDVSYIPFKDDSGNDAYQDLAWGAYGSFDFLNQDVFALYGTGGLAFHQVQLADRKIGNINVRYDGTGLLNYELGIGARFRLAHDVNFGLELHHSDSFSRNDIDVRAEGLNLPATSLSYRNVSLAKNEAIASLSFGF